MIRSTKETLILIAVGIGFLAVWTAAVKVEQGLKAKPRPPVIQLER